ncbi:MAG: chromosome segregation protein SMC [bacterium]|nr:MAG: chromosome segregation protein SMC [bacterium]
MSLSRLELVGFKSFMSPVILDFKEGITAILGPNGCGKTNIVDAVRWVLGEQSARQLRGAKMENIIFNGTEVHKPMGCAHVNLTIKNERGIFPLDYSEISITRKVYRSGVSEYFINKTPCRLKDVKELFADTGTGSHSYAVIEQEMIDYVLDDAYGERRHMFEEASGIVKYRMRREEAKRKLKLTDADLLRIEDIIEELGKQVRSLRYQMGKAKRYNTIKERIRLWELIQLRMSLSDLREKRRAAEGELAEAQTRMQTEDVSLADLERVVGEEKLQLIGLEKRNTELQNLRYDVRRQVQSSEEKIIQFTERKNEAQRLSGRARREIEEAQARLSTIAERITAIDGECNTLGERIEANETSMGVGEEAFSEIANCIENRKSQFLELKQTQLDFLQDQVRVKSSLEHYETVLGELDSRSSTTREQILELEKETKRISGEKAEREVSLQELESAQQAKVRKRERDVQSIEEIETRLSTNEERFSEMKTELAQLGSRRDLLIRMREDLEGFPSGARYVLKKGDGRVHGPLVEKIQVDARFRPAMEAVLGGMLDGVVVEDVGGAVELANELVGRNLGRARFLVRTGLNGSQSDRISEAPGLMGELSDFVSVDKAFEPLVNELLARNYLFETVDDALRFVSSEQGKQSSAVTLSGVYFCRGKGIYFSGGSDEGGTLLGRSEEIAQVEERIAALRNDIGLMKESCAQQRRDVQELKRHVNGLEIEIAGLREESSVKRNELQEIERNYISRKERCSHLLNALEEMEDSRVGILSKLEEARLMLQMQERGEEISGLGELEDELAALHNQRGELDEKLTEQKVELASLRGDLERKHEEIKGLREMEKSFHDIITQRSGEIDSADEETVRLNSEIETERAIVTELLERERSYQSDLDQMHGELEERRQGIASREQELKERKTERERIIAKENEVRIAISSLETRMNDLVDRARNYYNEDLSCYLDGQEIPLSEEEREVTPEMLEREKRRLDGMGPVNLAAAQEYEEKKERLSFLVSQKEDLVRAKEELNEAIRKINRRARKKFLATFEGVRTNFAKTFQILFEGGEADLSLAGGGDPLEADIVITARPKGKRLQDISLLSGGERALTALALLFALYMTKPSPFCIFDEVDAPLDDANIKRFVRMLERFQDETQFIIITHNKRTMEVANTLYGVTMEEHGVSSLVSVDLEEVERVLQEKEPAGKTLVESTISPN